MNVRTTTLLAMSCFGAVFHKQVFTARALMKSMNAWLELDAKLEPQQTYLLLCDHLTLDAIMHAVDGGFATEN
jgi:hypothetical protein